MFAYPAPPVGAQCAGRVCPRSWRRRRRARRPRGRSRRRRSGRRAASRTSRRRRRSRPPARARAVTIGTVAATSAARADVRLGGDGYAGSPSGTSGTFAASVRRSAPAGTSSRAGAATRAGSSRPPCGGRSRRSPRRDGRRDRARVHVGRRAGRRVRAGLAVHVVRLARRALRRVAVVHGHGAGDRRGDGEGGERRQDGLRELLADLHHDSSLVVMGCVGEQDATRPDTSSGERAREERAVEPGEAGGREGRQRRRRGQRLPVDRQRPEGDADRRAAPRSGARRPWLRRLERPQAQVAAEPVEAAGPCRARCCRPASRDAGRPPRS